MALQFLGKDPGRQNGSSPTVWREDVTGDYVLQGWVITREPTITAVGQVPPGETMIRFPERMPTFFPGVCGRAAS